MRVKQSDMSDEMQNFAVEAAIEASKAFSSKQEIARKVKVDLDAKYGNLWHCFVGTDFGCNIAHEKGTLMYFYLGKDAFIVWKTH